MPTLTSLRLFVVAAFAVCICAWLIATRKLQVYRTESKELEGALFSFVIGFSLLNCLEFFVFRKMKSSSTINHPLCGCESNVIQKKLPFRVQ